MSECFNDAWISQFAGDIVRGTTDGVNRDGFRTLCAPRGLIPAAREGMIMHSSLDGVSTLIQS